jgi:hypothetical protein
VNATFVSHAHEDRRHVDLVCTALERAGVETWVSHRDIVPGSRWDETIETALARSGAVVVVVSEHSVRSDYVRAEVEEAIRQRKTVIPLIVGRPAIPLRWRMLQSVKWSPRGANQIAEAIALLLPAQSLSKIRSYLEDSACEDLLVSELLEHPEWLPIEYDMADQYAYRKRPRVLRKSPVDYFAARMDSIGPRAFLYYFGSAYRSPISSSGFLSPELNALVKTVTSHVTTLCRPLRPTHSLAPGKLFQDTAWQWRAIGESYVDLRVQLVVGRRSHYGAPENEARRQLTSALNVIFAPSVVVEMMSYDRFLALAGSSPAERTRRS